MQPEKNTSQERNWAFFFSPCAILMIISGLTLLISAFTYSSMEAWLLIILCLSVFIVSFLIDVAFKVSTSESENRGRLVWIFQPIIVVGVLAFIYLYDLYL
jgi:hypothetical protein